MESEFALVDKGQHGLGMDDDRDVAIVLMAGRRSKKVARALVTVLFVCLGLAAAAAGGGFDDGGVVEPGPPPSGASGIGILDVANALGGRIVAAVGGLSRPSWFGAMRLSPRGRLDGSFGEGGYTAPLRLHGRGSHLMLHGNSVLSLSRGRVLVGGHQQNSEGGTAPLVAVYGPDGKLDRSFGQGGLVAPELASEGVDEAHAGEGGGILFDVANASGKVIGAGAPRTTSPAGVRRRW